MLSGLVTVTFPAGPAPTRPPVLSTQATAFLTGSVVSLGFGVTGGGFSFFGGGGSSFVTSDGLLPSCEATNHTTPATAKSTAAAIAHSENPLRGGLRSPALPARPDSTS